MRHIFSGPLFLGKNLEFVEDGFVVVEDGMIVDCGRGRKNKAKRHSIIPAFINAHTHIGDYFLREKFTGMPLDKVCGKNGLKNKYLDSVSDDIVIEGMKSAILEMMRTGTCCFSDFREGGIKGIKLLRKALSNHDGISAKIYGRSDNPDEAFLGECDGYGARSIRAEKIKRKKGKSIGIHVCETKSGELKEAMGFNPNFLVHMNCAGKGEISKVAGMDIPIVVCPRSNAYFGLKLPDIPLMLEEGILVCLGTDNAMTNSLSMISEMEFVFRRFMDKVDAIDILKMATVNPAKVFGWNCGFIEKGADANLLLLDESFLKTPNPYATVVLRLSAQKIEVMLRGKYVCDC